MATNAVDGPEAEDGAEGDPEFTVTVHLRSSPVSAAARRQKTVLDRVRELEAEGAVPELRVERWGARVSVPAEDAHPDDAAALFTEFEAAAEDAGLRLTPFFETRESVGGLLSSGPATERIIIFPVVSLTIRDDDGLAGLYPCWNDGIHQSVEDCLGALADGEDGRNL